MSKYKVAITKFKENENSVQNAVELADAFKDLPANAKVVIKPNILFWSLMTQYPKWGVITTSRVMELALPGQILLTRGTFDSARQHLSRDPGQEPIEWLAYGPFVFKGIEDPVDVFEVGVKGLSPLRTPQNTERGMSASSIREAVTLGWRPAIETTIPGRSILLTDLLKTA